MESAKLEVMAAQWDGLLPWLVVEEMCSLDMVITT